MRTVLITGADGFIGKNLVTSLEQNKDLKILTYNRNNTIEELEQLIKKSDFIFHLAGVNRPQDLSEYDSGNRGFTEHLLNLLDKQNRKIPVLFSSSIQATLNNPYGISKLAAEQALLSWSKNNGINIYIYRLPNVFGKWCHPNYNSVVATFCYNIARGLPININDPSKELTLVYIDDVVSEFINALNGNPHMDEDGYCIIPRTFKITLQELADKLFEFAQSRKSLIMPDFEDDFTRFLYATYVSYLPEDDFGYELDMKSDNRGWLAEFIKSRHFGQIFISKTKPGITRGNHWHHTKVEKFLVIQGEALIKFRQIRGDNVIEYRVSGDNLKVLDIPAGYTHSITNIGDTDLITIFWADEIFEPDKPDTYYMEV